MKVHPKCVKCWGVRNANTGNAFLFADALDAILPQGNALNNVSMCIHSKVHRFYLFKTLILCINNSLFVYVSEEN